MIDLLGKQHGLSAGRRLHALLGLRRSPDQRDRRHAELGGVVLLPAHRVRMKLVGRGPSIRVPPRSRSHAVSMNKPSAGYAALRQDLVTEVATPQGADRRRPPVLRSRTRRDAVHRRRMRVGQVDDRAVASCGSCPSRWRAIASGAAILDGRDLLDAFRSARCARCAAPTSRMIFQEPMTSLNPVLTIGRQIDRGDPRASRRSAARGARARPRGAAGRASTSPSRRGGSTSIRTSSPAACASA